MRRFIDEYYEPKKRQWLSPSPDGIKEEVLKFHSKGVTNENIVKYLQEWLYIFTDEEETTWELQVVENIINGKPIVNRFTKNEFK